MSADSHTADWIPATTRPKRSGVTLCKCGVTQDTFEARYEKERDRWMVRGQEIIFGDREVADAWMHKRRKANV